MRGAPPLSLAALRPRMRATIPARSTGSCRVATLGGDWTGRTGVGVIRGGEAGRDSAVTVVIGVGVACGAGVVSAVGATDESAAADTAGWVAEGAGGLSGAGMGPNGSAGATSSQVGNGEGDGIASRRGSAAGLAASSTGDVDAVAGSPDSGWLRQDSTSIISWGVRVISGASSSATGHRLHAPGSAGLRPLRPVLPLGPASAAVGLGRSAAGQATGCAGAVGWSALGVKRTWLCLLYTSPSPRDRTRSRMPSSA